MITFVYGAHGTGKTHYVFERLRESFKDSFLIVPEQMTVTAERRALEALPPKAQLDFEALNFTRLCNRIFRTYGGLSYHYINPTVRSLFMWRTLRELAPELEEYSASGKELALTSVMLNAAGELNSSGITPVMLEGAAEKISNATLRAKLRDIALISAAYNNLVSESYDDKSDDLIKLAELLKKHKFFAGRKVYIDAFTSFTYPEYAVIEQIFKQADDVTVTLACESPDSRLISCESVCDTAKKLIALAETLGKKTDKIYLTENFRAKNAELLLISSDLWRPTGNNKSDSVPMNERGNVKIYSCKNPYEEADAVVSIIRRELERGLRYRDIAVVSRNISKYDGILDTALESAKIPCYMSKKTDLASTPTVAFILSALRIKYLGYRPEDVISHLRTGLSECEMRDIDRFEEYIYTWKLSGERFLENGWSMNPNGYTDTLTERGKKILESANKIRSYLVSETEGFYAKLDAAENAREMCAALYGYICSVGLSDSLRRISEKELENGNKRAARDHLGIWNIIIDMLDDIAVSVGDEKLSVEEFYHAVLLCIDSAAVGSIPTGVDEVTLGSASLLRTENIRTAILIGMNEGEFPGNVTDKGIFTDSDRLSLKDLGINMSSDTRSRSGEELLFVNRAMTLPSEHLYLMYCARSADGAALRPSMPINRVKNLFGYIGDEIFNGDNPIDSVWTEDTAQRRLVSVNDDTAKQALKEELEARGICTNDAVITNSKLSASRDTADIIFGDRMQLSQTRIEKFIKCHLGYYCSTVLALRPEERAEIDSRVSGTLVHSVLEKFLMMIVKENGIDKDSVESAVDILINDLITEICQDNKKNSNRFKHLFTRLRRISMLLIKSLSKEFEQTSFRPELFELEIGKNGVSPLTVTLNDGTVVSLTGKIDRVDVWKSNGNVYIKIVDYKTGSAQFRLSDIKEGLGLQLVIYLFTVADAKNRFAEELGCLPGKHPIPAGANYLSSKIDMTSYSYLPSKEKAIDDAEKALNRSGFILNDPDVLSAVGGYVDQIMESEEIETLRKDFEDTVKEIGTAMKSGDASASPLIKSGKSPCNYCDMASFCRNAKKTRQFS